MDPVLSYATYLGGTGEDFASGIAVDTDGRAVVVGQTASLNFPTHVPMQSSSGGGTSDAFVTRFDPSGANVEFSTYLGGSDTDRANGVAVDTGGGIYVAGGTVSTNFPTMQPVQASLAGGIDAFLVALGSSGGSLRYSSYLGGSFGDEAYGVGAGSSGEPVIVGTTNSANFPVAFAFQSVKSGVGNDGFVARFSGAGGLQYSTYIGAEGGTSHAPWRSRGTTPTSSDRPRAAHPPSLRRQERPRPSWAG